MKIHIIIPFVLSLQCAALTYYVDPSCNTHNYEKKFDSVINEVKEMAKKAKAGLEDPKNKAMEHAFKIIFNSPRSNIFLVTKVKGVYETIAGMSEAASREVADVRIYGDNDDETPPDPNGKGGGGRWQHFVDPEKPNDPFNTRNLYDRFNGVLRSAGGQGVRPVAGMCYSTPMRLGSGGDYYAEKLQHSRDRAVITLHSDLWDKSEGMALIEDMDSDSKLIDIGMTEFDPFLSTTLLHELCHAPKVGFMLPADDSTSWSGVMNNPRRDDLPDAYSALAAFAMAIDKFDIELAEDDKKAIEGKFERLEVDMSQSSGDTPPAKWRMKRSMTPRINDFVVQTPVNHRRGSIRPVGIKRAKLFTA